MNGNRAQTNAAEQMARFSLIQGFLGGFSAGQMHITEDAHVRGLTWC